MLKCCVFSEISNYEFTQFSERVHIDKCEITLKEDVENRNMLKSPLCDCLFTSVLLKSQIFHNFLEVLPMQRFIHVV